MKHTIKFLAAVLLLAVFCSISPIATAQKPKTDEQIDLKAERREVQEFADSFLQSLDETKDIDKVPEKFFAADFKTRLAQNEGLSEDRDLFIQLSEGERYEYNILWLNSFYLQMMFYGGNGEINFADSDDDSSKKMFPPEALKLLKKSKIIGFLIDEDSEYEIKNLVELHNLITEVKFVVKAQRNYLDEHSQWKSKYPKNIAKARKRFKSYSNKFCEGEECIGFPEKTQIIEFAAFPLYLEIVRENGELKILNLSLYDE